jgi:hypothetical protein
MTTLLEPPTILAGGKPPHMFEESTPPAESGEGRIDPDDDADLGAEEDAEGDG